MKPFEEEELDAFDPALMELMVEAPPTAEGQPLRWEQIAALLDAGGPERLFAGTDPAGHLRAAQALALEDAILAMEFPDDD